MKFVAFVLSAKRLKRDRKKPRKRKFKAKIDTMVRRIERVRSNKEIDAHRKEAVRCDTTTPDCLEPKLSTWIAEMRVLCDFCVAGAKRAFGGDEMLLVLLPLLSDLRPGQN